MIDSGVGYRLLCEGEVIRAEDEYSSGYSWGKTGDYNQKVRDGDVPRRRAVRWQSEGWRYLDKGEVIVSGDEYFGRDWRVPGNNHHTNAALGPTLYRRRHPEPSAYEKAYEDYCNAPSLISDLIRGEDGPRIESLSERTSSGAPQKAFPAAIQDIGSSSLAPIAGRGEEKTSTSTMCGCGRHRIPFGADPYAAHQAWVVVNARVERGLCAPKNASSISAKAEIEVLCPDMYEP